MSITNQTTTDLSSAEARRLNNKIKRGLYVTWVQIAEAYRGRIHLALGYPSWNDYLTEEFGGVRPLWVPRERRPDVVRSLRQTGMSLRAIAAAMGVTDHTVRRDLDESTAANPAVELPATVTGLDGRERPARKPTPTPTPTPAPPVRNDAAAPFWKKATDCLHIVRNLGPDHALAMTAPGKNLDDGMAAVLEAIGLLQGIAATRMRAAS
jgi:hypothetical protein